MPSLPAENSLEAAVVTQSGRKYQISAQPQVITMHFQLSKPFKPYLNSTGISREYNR